LVAFPLPRNAGIDWWAGLLGFCSSSQDMVYGWEGLVRPAMVHRVGRWGPRYDPRSEFFPCLVGPMSFARTTQNGKGTQARDVYRQPERDRAGSGGHCVLVGLPGRRVQKQVEQLATKTGFAFGNGHPLLRAALSSFDPPMEGSCMEATRGVWGSTTAACTEFSVLRASSAFKRLSPAMPRDKSSRTGRVDGDSSAKRTLDPVQCRWHPA